MGSGKGSANYDGTGCEVNCNMELMDGENMLHHFLSISTNVFVEADPNNKLRTMIHPKVVAEYISNRNAMPDYFSFLSVLVNAEKEMFGEVHPPYFFLTDWASALSNAALELWCGGLHKIQYANIVYLALVVVESCEYDEVETERLMNILSEHCPTKIHECKAHVIHAVQKWSLSVKRCQLHRRLVNQFRRMIMHVAFHTSDGWKITEAIVQVGLLTYICSEQFIPCDPWDEDSVLIQEKSN
jgi:hypothetical protein